MVAFHQWLIGRERGAVNDGDYDYLQKLMKDMLKRLSGRGAAAPKVDTASAACGLPDDDVSGWSATASPPGTPKSAVSAVDALVAAGGDAAEEVSEASTAVTRPGTREPKVDALSAACGYVVAEVSETSTVVTPPETSEPKIDGFIAALADYADEVSQSIATATASKPQSRFAALREYVDQVSEFSATVTPPKTVGLKFDSLFATLGEYVETSATVTPPVTSSPVNGNAEDAAGHENQQKKIKPSLEQILDQVVLTAAVPADATSDDRRNPEPEETPPNNPEPDCGARVDSAINMVGTEKLVQSESSTDSSVTEARTAGPPPPKKNLRQWLTAFKSNRERREDPSLVVTAEAGGSEEQAADAANSNPRKKGFKKFCEKLKAWRRRDCRSVSAGIVSAGIKGASGE
ncbi:hypothetical protein HDU96_002426 [Phlyctochytrium bullatum]|nr:hypothetical protein HDU96_002426 [Phlyctochytrium bullatum]